MNEIINNIQERPFTFMFGLIYFGCLIALAWYIAKDMDKF